MKMQNIIVTEYEVERMVVAATQGKELVPATPAARELWEATKRDVAAIKARGGMVDIPFDVP